MNDELNIEIEYYESIFSQRTTNCLKRADILYIGQLTSLTAKEMLKWKNFGKKSLKEIREFLADKGLALKNETINPNIQRLIFDDIPILLEKLNRNIDDTTKKT